MGSQVKLSTISSSPRFPIDYKAVTWRRCRWFRLDCESVKNGIIKSPGRNWTIDEDNALIGALLDLKNSGFYRVDSGFQPGYLNVIEENLVKKFPGKCIKAKPHIALRVKALKRDFAIVHDMVNDNHTSGFSFDNEKKCVMASFDVWQYYLQSHKKAKIFREKPFPYYEDLCIIYGKDGGEAQGTIDMMEVDMMEWYLI